MLVVVLSLSVMVQASAPVTSTPEAEITLARSTIERLAKGEFPAVIATFGKRLREALPEEKLRVTWRRLETRAGRLASIGEVRLKDRRPLRGVVLTTQFDKRKVEIEVVFNAAGEIVGLLFD